MIIIAAIGLNSFSEDKLKKIILAGADVLRFNFSYNTVEENIQYIETANKIIDELNAHTKILIDLPINKVRLGNFDIKIFAVREGEEFIFKSASFSPDCNQFIPVNIPKLSKYIKPNQTITIGDGEVAVHVKEIIDEESFLAQILNNGVIQFTKAFNLNFQPPKENLINIYKKLLPVIKNIKPNFISVSYLGKKENEEVKTIFKNLPHTKIIIKIENQECIDNLDEIMSDKFYFATMPDQGEIGVNIPYEKIGIIQKNILASSKKHKKHTIFSTNIIESTMNNYIPSRTDIVNITNLVLENIYGVMLCQETAVGLRPAYSINALKKIIAEVEKFKK